MPQLSQQITRIPIVQHKDNTVPTGVIEVCARALELPLLLRSGISALFCLGLGLRLLVFAVLPPPHYPGEGILDALMRGSAIPVEMVPEQKSYCDIAQNSSKSRVPERLKIYRFAQI